MVNPDQAPPVVAVLGLGEAGSLIARDLLAAGDEQWLREHIAAELAVADARGVERIVDGTARHAVRRAAEMEAVADMLTELGVRPVMADASRAVHERLS